MMSNNLGSSLPEGLQPSCTCRFFVPPGELCQHSANETGYCFSAHKRSKYTLLKRSESRYFRSESSTSFRRLWQGIDLHYQPRPHRPSHRLESSTPLLGLRQNIRNLYQHRLDVQPYETFEELFARFTNPYPHTAHPNLGGPLKITPFEGESVIGNLAFNSSARRVPGIPHSYINTPTQQHASTRSHTSETPDSWSYASTFANPDPAPINTQADLTPAQRVQDWADLQYARFPARFAYIFGDLPELHAPAQDQDEDEYKDAEVIDGVEIEDDQEEEEEGDDEADEDGQGEEDEDGDTNNEDTEDEDTEDGNSADENSDGENDSDDEIHESEDEGNDEQDDEDQGDEQEYIEESDDSWERVELYQHQSNETLIFSGAGEYRQEPNRTTLPSSDFATKEYPTIISHIENRDGRF